MVTNYGKYFEKGYQKLLEKYDTKSEQYKQLKYEYQLLQVKYNTKEKQLNIAVQNFENNARENINHCWMKKIKKLRD